MKKILFLGGSSPIGQSCMETFLKKNFKVTYIGRKKVKINNKNLHFKKFDFQEKSKLNLKYKNLISKSDFSHICFIQRSRSEKNQIDSEINISIKPTINIIEQFIKHNRYKKNKTKKSILIFTSPASRKIALEQPISYHLGKAMVDQIVRFYSLQLAKINCNINAISPAFVLKKRAEKFYKDNKKLTNLINNIIPNGKMINTEEFAKIVFNLMSENFYYINGQIIDVDGGLNVHENASLSRLSMKVLDEF